MVCRAVYSRVSEKGFYFLENKNQAIEFKIPTPTPSYNDPPLLKITHQKGVYKSVTINAVENRLIHTLGVIKQISSI